MFLLDDATLRTLLLNPHVGVHKLGGVCFFPKLSPLLDASVWSPSGDRPRPSAQSQAPHAVVAGLIPATSGQSLLRVHSHPPGNLKLHRGLRQERRRARWLLFTHNKA